MLILGADPATSGLGAAAPKGIYTDNADLARLVWDRFNRHFDSFQNQGLEDAEPQPAIGHVREPARHSARVTDTDAPHSADRFRG